MSTATATAAVTGMTLRDRWRGATIASASLAALLILAMAAYRSMDVGIYDSLPPALRAIIGIPEGADVASLAYSAVFNAYGALTMGGVAIAVGTSLIAGEEGRGTMGVLLANPIGRRRVLAAKAAGLVAIVAATTALLWGAGVLAPVVLDVNVTGLHVGAFSLHFGASALFYGALALAIGAWTGSRGAAAGGATAVMVLGFFGTGLLPLVSGAEDAAQIFPWYYLSGDQPLLTGVSWAHVAVLLGGCVALYLLADLGLARRDLRNRSVGTTLLDRLRTHPVTKRLADRIAGSARVSRIWVKTASEHQVLLVIVVTAMFWMMGVMMGPLFAAIRSLPIDIENALPESLLVFFGGGNLSSPEGYYQVETFGMMTPLAIIVVAVAVGAKALAGEEDARTIALLLANPVPRSRVVLEKMLTMVLYAVVVGAATFAGVSVGSLVGGLGMNLANIAATCLLATLVSLVFGALALLLSAATGLVRIATAVPAGAAVGFHVLNSLGQINGAWWGGLSPFHYYLNSDPLVNGLDVPDALLLAAITVVLLALSVPAFSRRDLRQRQ
ncbi:ABC transporter permease subunit [Actinotalea sp.]|uniref:ABC transporter permease subunit n=1 Tax=Actinotalea sp. TaxID=1872145 RepID=UPI0035630AF2